VQIPQPVHFASLITGASKGDPWEIAPTGQIFTVGHE